jgi:hypothetical protein
MALNDATGLFPLRVGTRVKITHPLANWYNSTGTIARTEGRRVYVKLDQDDITCEVNHRSVEVLP